MQAGLGAHPVRTSPSQGDPIMSGRASDGEPMPTLAIVGGGFCGAVCAHQLARRAPGRWRIVVIEPRAELGRGVAYSSEDPAHRINVPALRMSFVPSDPCHFDRWLKADRALREDPAAVMPDGRAFPRRSVFGRYVAETVEPYLAAGSIEHRMTGAASIRKAGGVFEIALDDGTLRADAIAIAATHPSPGAPAALAGLAGDPRFIGDTQDRAALDAVDPDARVLIVGTGLTMADIVASLDARGHRGPIVAVSRRGLLSRGHTDIPGEFGDFSSRPSRTARELVRNIRTAVAAAERQGRPWHNVLDAVRTQARAIWGALDDRERRVVARRLRPFWDVHRFRVAPQVEAAIARLREAGRLEILTGEPVAGQARADALHVDFRLRSGASRGGDFDHVALATGPAHGSVVASNPVFASLAADGLIAPDAYCLGLATDPSGRAIGTDGRVSEAIWIVGPLARGAVGELMGLPEVARQAEAVAGAIAGYARAAAPERLLEPA